MSNGYMQSLDMHENALRIHQLSDLMRKHGFKVFTVPEGLAVEIPSKTKHGASFVITEIISTYTEANKIIKAFA